MSTYVCEWCSQPFEAERPARFCDRKCRQAAWRLRRARTTDAAFGEPGRFCYADPPYPGRAARYYGDQPTYAGEVDHPALIRELEAGGFMGWALSTSVDALRDLLPLCPPHPFTRVCAWVKPIAPCSNTFGLHNTWEPLIVVRGRQRRPGKRDWLAAQPARGGGDLPGRKPLAFCAFLFNSLGMQAGDELVDRFPGTGIVARSWSEASRTPGDDVSSTAARDAPTESSRGASSDVVGDMSLGDPGDRTGIGAAT